MVVRSVQRKPLTMLQLQKDVWKDVLNTSKKEILNELKKVENVPHWEWVYSISEDSNNDHNQRVRTLISTD